MLYLYYKYQFNMYKGTFCVGSPPIFMKTQNQKVKHFRGLYSRALF